MEKLALLFFLFIIYSSLGWIMECIYEFVKTKKFVNRVFLIGPYCPIYGAGCLLIIILLEKYVNEPIILFIVACVICSVLEYFTSLIMEIIFKNRWWDYSNMKFNINGRVCLETTIPFGLAGLGVVYLLHPSVMFIVSKIPPTLLTLLSFILAIVFLIDICISFDIIINFKNISKNIKEDNTEAITKKVKSILETNGFLSKRLIHAFPKMKIKLPRLKIKKR